MIMAAILAYNTVKAAIDNQVIILWFPPNTLYDLQLLNAGIFAPTKNRGEWF